MEKYLNVAMMILVLIGGFGMGGKNCPKFLPGRKVGTIEPAQIREASGVAASRKNPGVLWIHNDDGPAWLYALNTEGKLFGIYNFVGARMQDWEDIAIGPGPEPNISYLYIGAIGDNNGRKESITVYRVREPNVGTKPSSVIIEVNGVEAIEMIYQDGPKNAETLMVDPLTRDLYIVSKENKSRVYRAVYPQSTNEKNTLEYAASLSWGTATGGDISTDGQMIIVRGYFGASLWMRPKEGPLWGAFAGEECSVPIIIESQGEAICFNASGTGYFTTSEGRQQPIYYFEKKR